MLLFIVQYCSERQKRSHAMACLRSIKCKGKQLLCWTYQNKDTISVTAHEDKIVLFN